MVVAPTIAVFADGNEPIATGYLRAAGIPQSNGREFPTAKCGGARLRARGPTTRHAHRRGDHGRSGTCSAPNINHRNGALFDSAGNPRYCQIMSMHWGVNEREKVTCDGGACPATQAQCTGQRFTFNGHEVVAEVREFLATRRTSSPSARRSTRTRTRCRTRRGRSSTIRAAMATS